MVPDPSNACQYTLSTPSRSAVNATRLPSGVQTGNRLLPGSVVRRWRVWRARSQIQMSFCSIADIERDARPVRRQAGVHVGPRLGLDGFLVTLPVHPHQRARRAARVARHVDERAVARHAEIGRAAGWLVRTRSTTGTGSPRTSRRPEIEPNGAQRAGRRINQVTGLHVFGLAAAADQRLRPARLEIEHRHLRVLDRPRRNDREEHRADRREASMGTRWALSFWAGSGFVSTFGSPPPAGTLSKPVVASVVAKTIVSSGPQLAPTRRPGMRHTVIGGPPVIGTFLSSPLGRRRSRSSGCRAR